MSELYVLVIKQGSILNDITCAFSTEEAALATLYTWIKNHRCEEEYELPTDPQEAIKQYFRDNGPGLARGDGYILEEVKLRHEVCDVVAEWYQEQAEWEKRRKEEAA